MIIVRLSTGGIVELTTTKQGDHYVLTANTEKLTEAEKTELDKAVNDFMEAAGTVATDPVVEVTPSEAKRLAMEHLAKGNRN
jgi:hypothetical protein